MLRVITLAGCLALCAGVAAAQTSEQYDADTIAQARAEMQIILGYVDSALTEPVADLESRARAHGGRDELVYGLALKAGRLGPEHVQEAQKWMGRAFSHGRAGFRMGAAVVAEQTPYQPFSRVIPHSVPDRPVSDTLGANIDVMNPTWISTATACVSALKVPIGGPVDMSLCGGETEYQRLKALMPKPEN